MIGKAAQILAVSQGLFTSLPGAMSASVIIYLGSSVTLQLRNTPSNVTETLAALATIASSIGVDPSRITVTYNSQTNQATITIGTSTPIPQSPSTVAPVATPTAPVAPLITNITGTNTPHLDNVNLLANQCVFYTITINSQIVSANFFVSIQSMIVPSSTITLSVYLKRNNYPSQTVYDCLSPLLNNNNVFTFEWLNSNNQVGGGFYGNKVSTCQENTLSLSGNWYIEVCAGPSPLSFSFQASLVAQTTSTPPSAPTSNASTLTFFSGWLLLWVFLNKEYQ